MYSSTARMELETRSFVACAPGQVLFRSESSTAAPLPKDVESIKKKDSVRDLGSLGTPDTLT